MYVRLLILGKEQQYQRGKENNMDITVKGIPETNTEVELMEWVSILVERKEKAKLDPPEADVLVAQEVVDTYRVANTLKAKYAVVEEVSEVIAKQE